MRKIKFRAWDNHDQCWLNSFAIFYNGEFADMAKGVMHGDICQCDINYQKTPSHIIIEQFTGLYDKNGVEIYEGDVVKIVNNYSEATKKTHDNVVVKFKNGSFIVTWDVDGDEYYNHFTSYNTPVVTFEVIGNIHDQAKKDINVTIATKLTKTQSLELDKISSAVRNYINDMEALVKEAETSKIVFKELNELKKDVARYAYLKNLPLKELHELEELYDLEYKLSKVGKEE